MRNSIRELAFHYFQEIVNTGTKTPEELYVFADNFVNDIERFLSARRDFKEVEE